MNAVTIALSSQDILHQILSLGLLNQSDLRACCLVNSDWAAAGLILLWRYPLCHSLHSFRLLLDTLRHELDLSGPIASTTTPTPTTAVAVLGRSATMRESRSSSRLVSHAPSLPSMVPTPYRSFQQRKEYGIPFHGQRIYHRAQFIRRIDFGNLASALSVYHFEILARSCKIGFRSLDLRKVQLPFSDYLLSIISNSKALRQLTLGNMHVPLEALVFLEPCLSVLAELQLVDCPASMGDPELSLILQHCSQLQVLEVRGESFTDESLCWISKTCLNLEKLVIEAPRMTDAVVEQIVTACTRLRSWSLVDCTGLLDATVQVMERSYHSARDRRLYPCTQNDHYSSGQNSRGIVGTPASPSSTMYRTTSDMGRPTSPLCGSSSSMLTTYFPPFSSAVSSPSTSSASSQPDTDHSQSSLSSHHTFNHGSSFTLDRYSSTPTRPVVALGILSSMEFRNCTGIRPQLISRLLKSQPGLEHLVLGGLSITDEALDSLTESPLMRLQSLGLMDCGEISDETMMAVMFNCDQMKKLTVFGSNFTLRTFSSISLHLKQLEELHLEHVPLVMNESLQEILVKCTNLRVLKLWHCRNLTQDLFTDLWTPCANLNELEYMDKFPRPYADDAWEAQVVRFLRSLVIRFENLQILRLAKLADTWVPVNLVSYLRQLDLEKFTILQNPGLDLRDLQELKAGLPSLIHLGIGVSDSLSEEELLGFAQSNHRPGVQMFSRMLESSDELEKYVR
ncbi:hypothetical protein BGZ58_010797 [Dissophora ornata]|nr:hypothetical protein BGZ58_010797 [Dissophora ornata]